MVDNLFQAIRRTRRATERRQCSCVRSRGRYPRRIFWRLPSFAELKTMVLRIRNAMANLSCAISQYFDFVPELLEQVFQFFFIYFCPVSFFINMVEFLVVDDEDETSGCREVFVDLNQPNMLIKVAKNLPYRRFYFDSTESR